MVVNRHTNYKNKIGYSIAIAACLLFLALIVYVFVAQTKRAYVDTSEIEYIKLRQTGKNTFWDIDNSIAVSGPQDLTYMIDEENNIITLYYGKRSIIINEAALADEEFMQGLAEIGIHVYTRQNPDNPKEIQYKLTYWDDEIVRVVKRY